MALVKLDSISIVLWPESRRLVFPPKMWIEWSVVQLSKCVCQIKGAGTLRNNRYHILFVTTFFADKIFRVFPNVVLI